MLRLNLKNHQKVPLKRRNVKLKKHLEQTQNLKEHLEQAQLPDHDTNLWNSLPMKYFCYVKQAMTKFEKQTFSKLTLYQDELFRMNFEQSYEQNVNTRFRNRLFDEFEHLVKNVNLQLNCFEKSLVKEMKDDLKYVMSLEDEFDEKYSGEKNIIFRNETSSFETKIKELEMTLAQQTKYFEDAKEDFSKKTDKFETYFEKLKKTRVFLERKLNHKIQDSKVEKEQFLKQIASLESKLASQDIITNQKEYSDLRTSYNALKAKFYSLNQDKEKSPVSNFHTPKVSVSPKFYMGESSKSFTKRISQFTIYSLQKDRKFSKKPLVYETPTP
ncbi:hypothetical protein Tco_1514999 [Tanacetum coccineum]